MERRPDQWYLDALERKTQAEQDAYYLLGCLQIVFRIAVVVGAVALVVIAFRMM